MGIMNIGIDGISFYAPAYYLDLQTLAEARGVDYAKYAAGLGQERMAMPPPDEDIVTMAASAALRLIERDGKDDIELVLFATESGIDQSKAAALFAHGLLDLPKRCRAVEVKEACYAGTCALQLAAAMVARNPSMRALVLAADVARYDLGSPGEPTQGAGAVAMTVTADPRVMTLDPHSGFHAENVMDFWRPNYRDEALVDGKYSTRVYLSTMVEAWKQYAERSGLGLDAFARICFHLPFTRMAEKALEKLVKATGGQAAADEDARHRMVGDSLVYNRQTGNTYAASLYEGLCSLLDHTPEDLAGKRIGMFSYGSGCMAEFFSGTLAPGYRERLFTEAHREMMNNRAPLTYRQYEDIFQYGVPEDGGDHEFAPYRTGPFRMAGIKGHKRIYEKVPGSS